MFLILAESGDPLATQVENLFETQGRPARRLSEKELMEETPLAIERDGGRFGGLLRLPGGDLPLDQLSGVLVRMRRRWWPSSGFEPADQMFVYHETTAAVFCLLAGLRCPVMNRFDLGWWLCDPAYPERLREELADRLGWSLIEADPECEPVRVYAVDGRLIPASGQAVSFEDRAAALAEWQRRSGLRICRLDVSSGAEPALEAIDPCPSLVGESADLIGRVAAAAVEGLA
ncbi:MAG TPA: hypothetical protein VEL74_25595 [Thermoanaerobaculia bacterium]|nr:hypothetical protein [Thermoanaerobaculia bacterium]